MFDKKRIHIGLICCCLIITALLGTSCSSSSVNGITAQKNYGLSADTPKHLTQNLGSEIKIDADVTIPDGVRSVPILSAEPYLLDGAKLKQKLIGKNAVQQVKYKDESVQMVTSGLFLTGKDGKPIQFGEVAKQDNDRMLLYGGGLTLFMTTEYNYIFYAFQHNSTSGDYSADQYKQKSLPFMSPDTAFSHVVNFINDFGLDVSGSHDTYCLDSATTLSINGLSTMNHYICYVAIGPANLQNKMMYDNDDDFYFFTLYPKYHGIPITAGDGLTIGGGAFDIAYSERGIEYLSATTLYKEKSVLKPKVQTYGLNGALQALKHKYDQTILANPVKITGIRFCYVPVPLSKNGNEVELIPAWNFDVTQTVLDINGNGVDAQAHSGKPKTETVEIYFDATTGKEIIGSSPRL